MSRELEGDWAAVQRTAAPLHRSVTGTSSRSSTMAVWWPHEYTASTPTSHCSRADAWTLIARMCRHIFSRERLFVRVPVKRLGVLVAEKRLVPPRAFPSNGLLSDAERLTDAVRPGSMDAVLDDLLVRGKHTF